MEQYYRIAGLTVKMNTFGRAEEQAHPFLTQPQDGVDLVVCPNREEVKREYPLLGEDECEYIAGGRAFYRALVPFDGLMLHASAVAMDGKAYLFSADSGVGKSTHTALWRQTFGEERVLLINDDKPALRLQGETWYAYGTPWSGKSRENHPGGFPVGGICFLERGAVNEIEPYTGQDVVFRFLKQTYRFSDREGSDRLLDLIGSLLEKVPVWRLRCNMEREAALLSQRTITACTR